MVVVCAGIVSRSGRVLLGRSFVDVSKSRLEGLLHAFPKLVGPDAQHTVLEGDGVRYVYQPLEQVWLLLVTTKNSNIMEDLETLRLMAKLLPEYCGGSTEEQISENVYELTFAVDELLTHGGYREHVTLQQIRTFTDMDSHEEKLQRIITESKVNQARDEARRKAQDIDAQKAAMRAAMAGAGGGGSRYSSYGHDVRDDPYGGSRDSQRDYTPEPLPKRSREPVSPAASSAPKAKVKGMQLSKAKKTEEFLAALNKEEKFVPSAKPTAAAPAAQAAAASNAGGLLSGKSVRVMLEEKLVVQLDKEGGVRKLELKGDMKLTVLDPDDARIVVRTSGALQEKDGFKCRLHPKINKALWASEGALGLGDGKAFPVGSDNAPIILKWRKESSSEADLPLQINFWPNVEDGRSVVSVEYSAEQLPEGVALQRVQIAIPMSNAREQPDVASCEQGECKFDSQRRTLLWRIAEINDDNREGSMEFSVPELDGDEFFPIQVSFETANSLLSPFTVQAVSRTDGDKEVEYEVESSCSVESFTIE